MVKIRLKKEFFPKFPSENPPFFVTVVLALEESGETFFAKKDHFRSKEKERKASGGGGRKGKEAEADHTK